MSKALQCYMSIISQFNLKKNKSEIRQSEVNENSQNSQKELD